jgi:hypothetical protein
MPVRRETLYATNYLTGLVCMVSALVLAFALAGITAACFALQYRLFWIMGTPFAKWV